MCPDALQTMDTAKKSNSRQLGIRVSQSELVYRKVFIACANFTRDMRLKMASPKFHYALQFS